MEKVRNITTDQAIVGALIAKLREERVPVLQQKELGELMGVSASAWSRIEKGETSLSVDQLLKLINLLNLSADKFFKAIEEVKIELNRSGVEIESTTFLKSVLTGSGLSNVAVGAAVGMVIPVVGVALGGVIGGILGPRIGKLIKGSLRKDGN